MSITLGVSHTFTHLPGVVFDAWLDPKIASKFLFATPTGTMVKVEIDPRIGGRFNITERREGVDNPHVGEYLEIDRPRRLVFSFGDNIAFDGTTVTVEITPTSGGCELTLTHRGVLDQWQAQTIQGWTGILESQARALC